MSDKTRLIFFHDPGHGWLEVPRKDVRASGAEISAYSYTDGRMVYLEEDCDLGAFVAAIGGREAFLARYDVDDVYVDDRRAPCFIRELHPYGRR